jgi:hypothetical protein
LECPELLTKSHYYSIIKYSNVNEAHSLWSAFINTVSLKLEKNPMKHVLLLNLFGIWEKMRKRNHLVRVRERPNSNPAGIQSPKLFSL